MLTADNRIDVTERTLLNKLYMLKQEIEVFKFEFPNEYNDFMKKINCMVESYNSCVQESKKLLTFEINPEIDTKRIIEVEKLENTIRKFINSKVKFRILTKKLQYLIVRLNLLYSVSIFHSKDSEKKKVMHNIEQAIDLEKCIIQEFKECAFIVNDRQFKDEIVTLISYLDYEVFKTILRNSVNAPEFAISNLAILMEFQEFDYVCSFKAFLQDELANLKELACFIKKCEYQVSYKNQISKVLENIAFESDVKSLILDMSFWNEIFILESSILKNLKLDGFDKNKIKVKLLDRMNITVTENEVLMLPKSNASLALISIFSTTQNDNIFLLIKFINQLSDEITYKEIYYLLQLFDVMQVVKQTPNGLLKYMEKYLKKYPYDRKAITKKKEQVLTSSLNERNYVIMFNSSKDDEQIVQILKSLKMDYKIENGNIYISTFYFNGLDHVLDSLQKNTNQTI